jgi:hypothetical protein
VPDNLLIVMGISLGSAATATAVKAAKDASIQAEHVLTSDPEVNPPRFAQIFLFEEGAMADKAVDAAKFQNFWFTLILQAAYVSLAITAIRQPQPWS